MMRRSETLMRGAICATVLTMVAALASCRLHGERITTQIVEDRVLTIGEFQRRFQESSLFADCYWYFGDKDGYSYVEIDKSQPIDGYDDMFNRRVHHKLYRYRVSSADVEFSPKMPFAGYDSGKRIVPHGRVDDAHCVEYKITTKPQQSPAGDVLKAAPEE
jgi:hypothetical protein